MRLAVQAKQVSVGAKYVSDPRAALKIALQEAEKRGVSKWAIHSEKTRRVSGSISQCNSGF